MTRRPTLLLPLLAMLAACESPEQGGNGAAPPPAPSAALNEQPVRDEHRTAALTPQWLTGSWQTQEGDCSAGDTFFTLAPDGRYAFMQESGRWTLAGDQLTIEVTQGAEDGSSAGQRNTSRVIIVGPNEAEFHGTDGAPIRVYRCHAN